ncbi:MAG: hypothetical protein L0228_09560 [Planctomycetes bacterium]|nr:hypothetical protein [Planctomycetota bacterium]
MNQKSMTCGVGWLVTAIDHVVVGHDPLGRDRASFSKGRLTWDGPCPYDAMVLRVYWSNPVSVVMKMRDRDDDMTRRSSRLRGNGPSAVREVPGTDFDLLIYEGRDRMNGSPYYHFRIARVDGRGGYLATCRVAQLPQLLKAIEFAAIGFSRVSGLDPLTRERLAALALQLQTLSLPGEEGGEPKVNGVTSAFSSAD